MLTADVDEIVAEVPRSPPSGRARRPSHVVRAHRRLPDRVRRAWLSLGSARGRNTGRAARWPASRCRRACRERPVRSAPVLARDEGGGGTRREHHGGRGARIGSATRREHARVAEPARLRARPRRRRRARHHHRRHEVRVRSRRAGTIRLIDEVLTPDSSRFWPAESYVPGRSQPSFDKQPLRDYLDDERRAGRWNGEAPPPPLPPRWWMRRAVATSTRSSRITGTPLALTDP